MLRSILRTSTGQILMTGIIELTPREVRVRFVARPNYQFNPIWGLLADQVWTGRRTG
jgi:hypothetical protein